MAFWTGTKLILGTEVGMFKEDLEEIPGLMEKFSRVESQKNMAGSVTVDLLQRMDLGKKE